MASPASATMTCWIRASWSRIWRNFSNWREARDEDDLRAAMIQDVGHAVRGFVEVDGDGDRTGTVDGEIGGVPFGTVGSKDADTIAGFYAEFDQGIRQTRHAAKEFLGGDGFPALGGTEHLSARGRMLIDGAQESRKGVNCSSCEI